MNNVMTVYNYWLESLKDFPEFYDQLKSIENNPSEIEDRFYTDLTFGTAGLRGVMDLGSNRMNYFTVGRATQGLADYLKSKNAAPSVAIGYDSRNNSLEFAQHAASIFAANGCKVHIYGTLVPTPVLAFGTKVLGCDCGVMLTASHNPAEYNGYKVFNTKACQIDNDIADDVLDCIEKVDTFKDVKKINFEDGINSGQISYMPPNIIDNFFSEVAKSSIQPEICKDANLRITYTPLNGTGNLFVRKVFADLGVTDVHIVPQQELPDGNFPTCPYPNPEFKEALELGLKLARETQSDLLMATDPDADRVAIAVADGGDYTILTGNQLGTLLVDYIAKARKAVGSLPANPVACRSIVSSKLFDKVAGKYGVPVKAVLTGFKHIGEYMDELEEQGREDDFIFGYEEACGFLIGKHVRDKDAVVTCGLIAEMFSYYKLNGLKATDVLHSIYEDFNYYSDMADNLEFKGSDGMDKMLAIMSNLRSNPPNQIVGVNVKAFLDYLTLEKTENGVTTTLDIRPSNVLEFHMEDGAGLIIRPSGTEPKLKIYYALPAKSAQELTALEQKYKKAGSELTSV